MLRGAHQKGTGTGSEVARLGQYVLGSPQSRAAARALLERRFAGRKRIDVVSSIPRPRFDGEIRIGSLIERLDGTIFRYSNIPPGMTIEEAERIVLQPGGKPTVQPAEPERIRPPLRLEWGKFWTVASVVDTVAGAGLDRVVWVGRGEP